MWVLLSCTFPGAELRPPPRFRFRLPLALSMHLCARSFRPGSSDSPCSPVVARLIWLKKNNPAGAVCSACLPFAAAAVACRCDHHPPACRFHCGWLADCPAAFTGWRGEGGRVGDTSPLAGLAALRAAQHHLPQDRHCGAPPGELCSRAWLELRLARSWFEHGSPEAILNRPKPDGRP